MVRQIDAVQQEKGWVLAWIVDDVQWARWCAAESAWIQMAPGNIEATSWQSQLTAERYLAANRTAMKHAHFAVHMKPSVAVETGTHAVWTTGV